MAHRDTRRLICRTASAGVCGSMCQADHRTSRARAASAARAAAAFSASTSHLSSRSGSSRQRGAVQHRSQNDRAGLSVLGSLKENVRLGQATQQQQQQHLLCLQAARVARTHLHFSPVSWRSSLEALPGGGRGVSCLLLPPKPDKPLKKHQ